MDETGNKCSRCGAIVTPGTLQGICPRCLLALNLAAPTELPGEDAGPGGTQPAKAPLPMPSIETLARLFPQLEIIETLGRGGMGAVYKARQPKLDRFVALKLLLRRHEDAATDSTFADRFGREARALARLNHPDIVAVYDYGEAGGYHYLVMEYVDGLTLREVMQRRKLEPGEALVIVPKICEALQFAHQQGVVHRDIKPENILIDKQGRVKIADFGIAKIVAPGAQEFLTGGKDVIGTPHYMAPEQVEQPGKVDHRADIFSLGVVFYEMLTGELPLGKFQPPSRKVRVDVRLDEIVLHALEKEPERRYQHASHVKTDVETYASAGKSAASGRLRPALVLLSTVLLLHGFYALLETILKQGPGLLIVPNVVCLAIGVGLLRLWPWARLLALAWVWSFYALNIGVVLFLVAPGAGFAFSEGFPTGTELKDELFGLWIEERSPAAPWIIFVALMATVIWTHWLLSRHQVKQLFRASFTPPNPRRVRWAFAAAVLVIVAGTLLWQAAPKNSGYILAGSVTDFVSGLPIEDALVTVSRRGVLPMLPENNVKRLLGRKDALQWQDLTDTKGRYRIPVPAHAGVLYIENGVLHGAELTVHAMANGYEPFEIGMGEIAAAHYYRRVHHFQLQPWARAAETNGIPSDPARAVALFNEIEDFGHEFEAAFASKNLAAAQTGSLRLLTLLTNFNATVRGTGLEFPGGIFKDIEKVRQALDEGDWDKTQKAAAHNEEYAQAFKRIGARMVELARQQKAEAPRSSPPQPTITNGS